MRDHNSPLLWVVQMLAKVMFGSNAPEGCSLTYHYNIPLSKTLTLPETKIAPENGWLELEY